MPIPVITSALRAGGNVGTGFSYTIVATNSPTLFNASLPAGGLPAGLSIDTATGILSGTPTAHGIFSIRLRAQNGSGTGLATLDLHISFAGAPIITSAATASGTVGTPFSYSIVGTFSPTSYGASVLPPGVTVNTSTGLVSGTPTTAGSYSSQMVATNANGFDRAFVDITIAPSSGSVPVITSSLNVTLLEGDITFSYQITATNTPTSFDAASLPPGLSVNPTTGLITGPATMDGLYTSTVSAINGSGTGTATVTFLVLSSDPGDDSGIPTGLAVLQVDRRNTPASFLSNEVFDIICISQAWAEVEPTAGAYDFSYLAGELRKIAAAGKKAVIGISTGGGSRALGGNVPTHVLTAMGANPNSRNILPGITYTFNSDTRVICIPVFFNTTYVAKKNALYQAAGDYFTNTTELTDAEKAAFRMFRGSFANALTENWFVPHGTDIQSTGGPHGVGYTLNEVNRWLHLTSDLDPGAGYTTALIKAAGESLLTTLLTAFPGKFLSLAVGTNGVLLDTAAAGGVDVTNYLAKTVATDIYTAFPRRILIQRDDVTSFMPKRADATGTDWQFIDQWRDLDHRAAGQNLYFVWGDTTDTGGSGYIMNGGTADDPDGIIPNPPGLTASQIFRKAAERAATYTLRYLEILEPDALKERPADLAYVRSLFFEGTLPDAPVITSDSPAPQDIGVPFTYQITATNNPLSFAAEGLTSEFRLDPLTGIIIGRTTVAAVLTVTISATNAGGTGSADITITIVDESGGGSGGNPPPPPNLVAQEAFPELSSSSEDEKDFCPDYILKLGGNPPRAPRNLVVTTPQRPDSGIATATWIPPEDI